MKTRAGILSSTVLMHAAKELQDKELLQSKHYLLHNRPDLFQPSQPRSSPAGYENSLPRQDMPRQEISQTRPDLLQSRQDGPQSRPDATRPDLLQEKPDLLKGKPEPFRSHSDNICKYNYFFCKMSPICSSVTFICV